MIRERERKKKQQRRRWKKAKESQVSSWVELSLEKIEKEWKWEKGQLFRWWSIGAAHLDLELNQRRSRALFVLPLVRRRRSRPLCAALRALCACFTKKKIRYKKAFILSIYVYLYMSYICAVLVQELVSSSLLERKEAATAAAAAAEPSQRESQSIRVRKRDNNGSNVKKW